MRIITHKQKVYLKKVFNLLEQDFMKRLLMIALISLSAVALFAQGAKETTPTSVEDFNITIKMSHVFAPN